MNIEHGGDWPTVEEIGNIMARLIMADEEFLAILLSVAKRGESHLLEGDVRNLEKFGIMMGMLINVLQKNSPEI